MIDAKRSIHKILREWGHDVHIQRMLPNGNHSDRFQRVTTRAVGQSGIGNATSTRSLDEGLFKNYDMVFYFESSVNPKEGDRIYENYSMKASKNYTMFRIEAVSATRGRLGKIAFWVVGASREK